MENFSIKVDYAEKIHEFEVGEYPHYDDERCKYRVYKDGTYVASFEPDRQNYLHVCQNAAGLDEELLDLLADYIESRIPHPRSITFNEDESES
ncbi:hypothetical protein B0I27_104320 [Arcticibacter pallidicorallinus]|uniref:Uncharacterized protein n=1 Tax=Arcticibacter pallidicorallinus TaxID=1259464 RepID=A0A2T0U5X1_9SPHI|nr:hypothetical protein [Arcticibacter pallidicorallinus]PRY53310.1 hypothetical protein B0I27_104320 [Arcticibacter pallidicorallinus]